ncbi:MAG: hypothetical protein D6794_00220, partial [Deltaproteobacteria bacterium]
EATIQAIVFVVQSTPMGTNLGLVWMMWAMVNGCFLQSRGAIFAALQAMGLDENEMRRSWSAMAKGSWQIDELIETWQVYVRSENRWSENRYQGYRVVSIDITGFWRPKLQGWAGKHYHSIAGKALPAVVFGVMAVSGRIHEKRIPLLHGIVRCPAEQSEAEFRVELLKQAARRCLPDEVQVLDAGFKLSEIHAAELHGYVVRLQSNCTARRNELPEYKGIGARPKYGEMIRPLARRHKGKEIPASQPDETTSFDYEGRTIQVALWRQVVTRETQVSSQATSFSIFVLIDPLYTNPLVLATDLLLSPESAYLIYRDRWPVEQPPLAAKQMIGLHRQFVFAGESCYRLPELALLAGSILSHVAAGLPPIPSGFWDRKPKATPGRLRRLLGQADFPSWADFDPQLRKKASVTDHLPKG